MPGTIVEPSYDGLTGLAGQQVAVVEDGESVELTLECVSTPVTFEGYTSFDVILTGPVDHALASGAHLLRAGNTEFWLGLVRVARDMRYLHYEAHLVEA